MWVSSGNVGGCLLLVLAATSYHIDPPIHALSASITWSDSISLLLDTLLNGWMAVIDRDGGMIWIMLAHTAGMQVRTVPGVSCMHACWSISSDQEDHTAIDLLVLADRSIWSVMIYILLLARIGASTWIKTSKATGLQLALLSRL